jgi:2,4-diketo-3-deoxy-L-fuconate hydrolase
VKIANLDGRAVLVLGDQVADIATASDGRFGPDPMALYEDWDAFTEFAAGVTGGTGPLDEAKLANPAPAPRQVFAIGLNYRSHAEESGMAIPEVPATFTKFPASLSGPFDPVEIVGGSVDWEVELVAVIGRRADRVAEADGGPTSPGSRVGQDISDRHLQFAAGMQFSLGKSRRGYGPMGPWLVTPDELTDPDDLALGCSVDGETVQDARSSDLIFGIPRLVAELSAVLPLLAGRRDLHRHPGRRGHDPPARPVAAARPGARVVDRRHRHHPQPLRVTRERCRSRHQVPQKVRYGPNAAGAGSA